MKQDNLEYFAYAAFRLYGHTDDIKTLTSEDALIVSAAASTLRHLKVDRKLSESKAIEYILCELPMGHIARGTISNRVKDAAYNIVYVEETTIWRYLHHARMLFDRYYNEYYSQQPLTAAENAVKEV